ncbi:hypothetical protein [Nocardioides euryhalodurans]|uniref:Uncharacterized protein n=1 Tax=Nocardioides euryhalodurans TaxID=2518370 RepID=A0A4P7GGM4_9ACTN|nr:hypothetical protein [Nocardioides euryhalodurans]QBR90864.1 hypothetical protein EXE57_00205 [Nocardioides euryhalodurans]
MPGELTTRPSDRVDATSPVREAVLLLALFAAGGAVAGLVWHWLWSPPSGVVLDGVWYPDAAGLTEVFPATGLYVLVGVVTGLPLGVTSGLVLARRPLVTLALVVVGSALAAWLMLVVGQVGAPPDPQPLAARAANGTTLPGTLAVSGWSPFVAIPIGALAGLCTILICVSPRPPVAPTAVGDGG